ncbi:MAG: hypothetical protein ABWZ80_10625, partial [Beijerinckiaceae bacterium]
RFPAGQTYIIQLSGTQVASGLGEYLAPPLRKAFDRAGLTYHGGPGAAFAATIRTSSDVGKWYGSGDGRRWLYTRQIEIGLTPANEDAEPPRGSPAFAATARLITPDADRVDELNCLVALAVREITLRYRARGRIAVDGASCAR